MPKAWPLCTGAELNLGDRVLGEVEKKSFIALPGKGGHSRILPLKTMCPLGFPGGTVFKNPPANAGDMGSSPALGRSHMPWSN